MMPTVDDIASRWVTPTPDLGSHPEDRARAADVGVLAHLADALPRSNSVTVADLVAARTPDFTRAPDPFALFAKEHAEAKRPTRGGKRLRVLSYNTALLSRPYLNMAVRMPEYAIRRTTMPEALFGDGWDILLLQEVWDDVDLELFTRAAARHGYRIWGGTPARHRQHGVVIALRDAIVDDAGPDTRGEGQYHVQYPLEERPGPNIRRGWLSWRFRHARSGLDITAFSTHMTPFPHYWRQRCYQARELGLQARQAPADDLVIVGGDMNGGPYYPSDAWTQPSGRVVTNWWRNAVSYPLLRYYGGLRDAAIEAGMGAALPHEAYTATDHNSLCHRSYAGLEFQSRMDHVLLRDHTARARVSKCELAYTELRDWGTAGRFELSDHYGVGCELKLYARTTA